MRHDSLICEKMYFQKKFGKFQTKLFILVNTLNSNYPRHLDHLIPTQLIVLYRFCWSLMVEN